MNDKEEYMEKLNKIQRDLNWIIQYLIKKDETTEIPPYNPNWPTDNNSSVKCSKCGMVFEGATSYYCPDSNCPIFSKIMC